MRRIDHRWMWGRVYRVTAEPALTEVSLFSSFSFFFLTWSLSTDSSWWWTTELRGCRHVVKFCHYCQSRRVLKCNVHSTDSQLWPKSKWKRTTSFLKKTFRLFSFSAVKVRQMLKFSLMKSKAHWAVLTRSPPGFSLSFLLFLFLFLTQTNFLLGK